MRVVDPECGGPVVWSAMPRTILVTEGSSPLGAALVRRLAARGYSVAAACDRAGRPDAPDRADGVPSGEPGLSLPWNRRSAASARTILLTVTNTLGPLDEALILEPALSVASGSGAAGIASASSADVDRAFDDAKGPFLAAREVLAGFLARGAGVVTFVGGGPASGPLEAAVREAFRGMAAALMSSPGSAGIVANGFQAGPVEPEEYAAFIDRTLEERARKTGGRWYAWQSRPGLFQGGRSRRQS